MNKWCEVFAIWADDGADDRPERGGLPHWYDQGTFCSTAMGMTDHATHEVDRWHPPAYFVTTIYSESVYCFATWGPKPGMESRDVRVLQYCKTINCMTTPHCIQK